MTGAKALIEALTGFPPTEEQLAMITEAGPATLVIAGAGSGKTETMASRVVWSCARLDDPVLPEEVLGLTFTRKAAGELSQRITRRLRRAAQEIPDLAHLGGPDAGVPTISTYDSFAGRLVREHGLRVGIEPDSVLQTESATWQLAQEVVRSWNGPTDLLDKAESTIVSAVLQMAGQVAEHPVTLDEVQQRLLETAGRMEALAGESPTQKRMAHANALRARAQIVPMVRELGQRMRAESLLDFTQQKALAAQLAAVPEVQAMERSRYRAVLLDEFQDTSFNQLRMLAQLFGGGTVQVTAVGDPHQSIYGWRGAGATMLQEFAAAFSAPQQVVQLPLSTSWRNDHAVLAAANIIAGRLREGEPGVPRIEVEKLRARDSAGPGAVRTAYCESTRDEAALVVSWLVEQRAALAAQGDGHGPVSAAILCRQRALFPSMIAALEQAQVEYEVLGVGGLLFVPEVADLLALLSVVADPLRGDRLMRLLTGPVCRLGAADVAGLAALSHALTQSDDPRHESTVSEDGERRVTLVEALLELPHAAPESAAFLSETARVRLGRLARSVERLRGMNQLGLPELVLAAERELGLDIEVIARPEHPGLSGRRHLDAFLDEVSGFVATAARPTLGSLIAWLDAAAEQERGLRPPEVEVRPEVVQVLTCHAAKGLEWDVVAVPGMVESAFPGHSSYARWKSGRGWDNAEPKELGWLRGLADIPYSLRGDADGLPRLDLSAAATAKDLDACVASFAELGGVHGIFEERRLAYVALTRARSHLLLSGSLWKPDAATPRLPSRFLLEVHEQLPADPDLPWVETPTEKVTNPFLGEPAEIPWPRERPAEAVQQLADAAAAVDAAQPAGSEDLELERILRDRAMGEARPVDQVVAPRRLSPSRLIQREQDPETFREQLRRPLPRKPRPSAVAGTRFHEFVQNFFASDQLPVHIPDGLDLRSEEEIAADEQTRDRFLASPWASMTPVAVEQALFTTIGRHRVPMRIDAVFADGEDYVIVDWKTGRVPADQDLARKALQLAVYRLAYARYRGVPLERVRACFYYVASGVTQQPPLLGEEELEALFSE